MTTRRRYAFYAAATITAATLGGCALVAGLFEPRPLHCSNGIQDGNERGVDCGGACPLCDGAKCGVDSECTSQRCVSGKCSRPACLENSTNEADTCSACHRCPVEEPCASNLDCLSGYCEDGVCAACSEDTDCVMGSCVGTICVAVTCNNGVKDNSEKGVDCGGDCALACPDGPDGGVGGTGGTGTGSTTTSSMGTGAMGGMGTGGMGGMGTGGVGGMGGTGTGGTGPSQCADGMMNGNETDVDCGGMCSTCGNGKDCISNTDCTSGICNPGVPPQCGAAKACTESTQCNAGICVNDVCRGADCALPVHPPGCGADEGMPCQDHTECWSGGCVDGAAGGECAPLECLNGVKDIGETDADCGGSICPQRCGSGATCTDNMDCQSLSCVTNTCM